MGAGVIAFVRKGRKEGRKSVDAFARVRFSSTPRRERAVAWRAIASGGRAGGQGRPLFLAAFRRPVVAGPAAAVFFRT